MKVFVLKTFQHNQFMNKCCDYTSMESCTLAQVQYNTIQQTKTNKTVGTRAFHQSSIGNFMNEEISKLKQFHANTNTHTGFGTFGNCDSNHLFMEIHDGISEKVSLTQIGPQLYFVIDLKNRKKLCPHITI